MSSHIGIAALVTLSLAACASGPGGALGQATFSGECASDDSTCQAIGLTAPIAVGGSVEVQLTELLRGGAASSIVLMSARESIVRTEGSLAIGVAEGRSSLLAMSPEGEVLDFFHLTTKAIDALGVTRKSLNSRVDDLRIVGTLQALVGDDMTLAVQPMRGGKPLLGDLGASWSVSGDAVVLLDGSRTAERRVVARTAGSAKLSVTAAGFTRDLEVEVMP